MVDFSATELTVVHVKSVTTLGSKDSLQVADDVRVDVHVLVAEPTSVGIFGDNVVVLLEVANRKEIN